MSEWINFENEHPEDDYFLTCDVYNPKLISISRFNEGDLGGLITTSVHELPIDYEATHWLKIPPVPPGD